MCTSSGSKWLCLVLAIKLAHLALKQSEASSQASGNIIFEAWVPCSAHILYGLWHSSKMAALAAASFLSFSFYSSSFHLLSLNSFFLLSLFALLVLSLFLQIRALIIVMAGIYQVLTMYQAVGSPWAPEQPSEEDIVIIIPTLQTNNWSEGELGNLPKGAQQENIGKPHSDWHHISCSFSITSYWGQKEIEWNIDVSEA